MAPGRGGSAASSHIDLIAPRVRSLEGMILAWSPGTKGKPVDAPVMILPDAADSAAFASAVKAVKGAYVLISAPELTCRPDSSYKESALPDEFDRMVKERTDYRAAWAARIKRTGLTNKTLQLALEAAGAKGVLTSNWSQGWGVFRVFDGKTTQVPAAVLSCEDYGLVYRLTERKQGPVLRITAESQDLGEVPVFNTIATIPGQRPRRRVRGALRPLRQLGRLLGRDRQRHRHRHDDGGDAHPRRPSCPGRSRTIIVGPLERGRAGAERLPRLHGGSSRRSSRGCRRCSTRTTAPAASVNVGGAGPARRQRLPGRLVLEGADGNHRQLQDLRHAGQPRGGGSDNASVACYGAPGFGLGSLPWEYFSYTWHTNRDTYDKLVMSEVRNNATLTAMLVYQAAQDSNQIPRVRRVMPVNPRTGQQTTWPECTPAARSFAEYTR